jgi:hypothetical protein
MSITTFQVALWVELLAAGLGGLQGALFAAVSRHRRIDVLGVLVIGLIVALGGSLLRDVVLNQPPVVIWMNWYLVVAGAAALIGMILQPLIAHVGWLITVLDAIVMGLFGAIGATKALSLGVGEVGALVVGVIGAIGGGMLRDIVLSLPSPPAPGSASSFCSSGSELPCRSREPSALQRPRSSASWPLSSAGPSPSSGHSPDPIAGHGSNREPPRPRPPGGRLSTTVGARSSYQRN